MKTISNVLKRIGMVTHVVGIDSIDEITIHERHHYYFNVKDELAPLLFKDFDNVISSNSINDVSMSASWAGLTFAKVNTLQELREILCTVSTNEGIIVYRYDNLLDDENEKDLDKHITLMKTLGFLILSAVEDSQGKYIIAKFSDKDFLEIINNNQLKKHFIKPLANTDVITNDEVLLKVFGIKQKRRLAGSHPSVFNEKNIPLWKDNYFKDLITLGDDFLKKSTAKKFKKRPIKMPNKEQAMVLLANGNFEKEFTLKNGSLMSFKSTEIITYEKRLKFNDANELVAERDIMKRNAAVLGLNYTNGTIITFS